MTSRPDGAYVPRTRGLDRDLFELARTTGTLHLQQCPACGRVQHPPRFLCASCAARDLSWVEAQGTGTVYSWTVSHFTIDRAWTPQIPFATVVVEATEGVRLVGSYSGDDAELHIGQPVRIRTEPVEEGFAYIWFDAVGDPR